MKIHDDHRHHGAALIQIAEHNQFTAINSLKVGRNVSRVAYCVNDNIAVYLKYATEPQGRYDEYVFTFTKDQIGDLAKIQGKNEKTFIALVCAQDREICCITYAELVEFLAVRRKNAEKEEGNLTLLVTVPKGKSLRAYVNAAGVRNTKLGEKIVARNRFPDVLFQP